LPLACGLRIEAEGVPARRRRARIVGIASGAADQARRTFWVSCALNVQFAMRTSNALVNRAEAHVCHRDGGQRAVRDANVERTREPRQSAAFGRDAK
jgi:hypothetical protein